MQTKYLTDSRTIAMAVIISNDGKVLFGKKGNSGYYPECWHLPGGGVEEGETLVEALTREIREETGIDLSQEEVSIEMIDDQGRGEHLKTNENGEKVMLKMAFKVFLVKIDKSAYEINAKPGDDLEELGWIGLHKLSQVKHTPPSTELFQRLELI